MMMRSLWLMLTVVPLLASADWVVDGAQSHVGFASVKNEVIAENHQFTAVSGRVGDDGQAEVQIELASVATGIPIRDERMRELLFEVERYPLATVTAQLPMDELTQLAAGESKDVRLDMTIKLHGDALLKPVPVRVTRITQGGFEVSTRGPILIHAAQFSLAAGIGRLQEIAGLKSIDWMVPVTFNLRLVAAD